MFRSYRVGISLTVLFLVVAGICGYIVWLSKPAEGVIIQPVGTPPAELLSQESTVRNDCFGIVLKGVEFVKQETTTESCIVRAAVVKPRAQLAITLALKENAILAEETGVTFRRREANYTEVSKPQTVPNAVTDAVVFESDTEITGFFVTQKGVLTVSVHSFAAKNPEIEHQFEQFVAAVEL